MCDATAGTRRVVVVIAMQYWEVAMVPTLHVVFRRENWEARWRGVESCERLSTWPMNDLGILWNAASPWIKTRLAVASDREQRQKLSSHWWDNYTDVLDISHERSDEIAPQHRASSTKPIGTGNFQGTSQKKLRDIMTRGQFTGNIPPTCWNGKLPPWVWHDLSHLTLAVILVAMGKAGILTIDQNDV